MSKLATLARGNKAKVWGRFGVEVEADEVNLMLKGVEEAYKPTTLAAWMEAVASPIMAEGIVQFFAYEGEGGLSGGWAPLQESTIRIKAALRSPVPEGINTRSEEMLSAMLTDHEVMADALGATMQIPGDGDAVLEEKLKTAKHGRLQAAGDMMPGAYTPPRPVAVITDLERSMLMMAMQYHIISMAAGGRALSGPI